MYLAFLAVSCAGFSSLAARDFVALGTSRRFAATAIKECATMLDLHNAGEKKEGDKNASGSSAVAVKSKKKGKRSRGGGRSDKVGADFWKELSYLVKVAGDPTHAADSRNSPRSSPSSSCVRFLPSVRTRSTPTTSPKLSVPPTGSSGCVGSLTLAAGWVPPSLSTPVCDTETLIPIELRNALTRHAQEVHDGE